MPEGERVSPSTRLVAPQRKYRIKQSTLQFLSQFDDFKSCLIKKECFTNFHAENVPPKIVLKFRQFLTCSICRLVIQRFPDFVAISWVAFRSPRKTSWNLACHAKGARALRKCGAIWWQLVPKNKLQPKDFTTKKFRNRTSEEIQTCLQKICSKWEVDQIQRSACRIFLLLKML